MVTTTPRPTRLIKDLVAREGRDGIVITRSTTYDNRANLAPSFFAQLVKKYEGTRTGKQELLAELLTDVPGAIVAPWSASKNYASTGRPRSSKELSWRLIRR